MSTDSINDETAEKEQLLEKLRFADEKSIAVSGETLTFKAKPGLSNVQFALLFMKVKALGGSYSNATGCFTVHDHVEAKPSQADTVETAAETQLNLFQRIERRLSVSGETLDTASKKLNVGRATVAKVKRILNEAPEEIKQQCRSGRRTVNAAYELVRDGGD